MNRMLYMASWNLLHFTEPENRQKYIGVIEVE